MNLKKCFPLAMAVLPPVVALADDLRPAPDYFVDAMTAITTAENIATACPSLVFDATGAADVTTNVLGRLAEDGFDAKNLSAGMADPGDAVRSAQAAFRERHGLSRDGNAFVAICEAGLAEIAEGSQIGAFLAEITGEGAVDPTQDTAN